MVDRVHCHFPLAWLICIGCRAALLNSPLLLCFFHGALPPATCSPASSRNGSGIQLRWGKASPRHGDCNGGVRTTDGASYVTGHGARRLDHNRRAGMVRVQRHWPVMWCVWASQCSSGHVGQVEGSSRASGGLGHGGGLPSTTAASVWGLWPQRGVTVGSVGSYGSMWMQRGRPELRVGLPVSRWPVGCSRWPRRHGDDGEARGSLRGSSGVVTACA